MNQKKKEKKIVQRCYTCVSRISQPIQGKVIRSNNFPTILYDVHAHRRSLKSRGLVNIDFLSRGKGRRKFTSAMLQIPRRGVNDYCLSRSRSSADLHAKENRGGALPERRHVTFRIDENFRAEMQREKWRRIAFYDRISQREPVTLMNAKTLIVPFVFRPTSPTCSNFSSSSFA